MGTTPPVWKEQRLVESHEIDMFGALRPHVLFGFLLNSAWNLARGTSFGYQRCQRSASCGCCQSSSSKYTARRRG